MNRMNKFLFCLKLGSGEPLVNASGSSKAVCEGNGSLGFWYMCEMRRSSTKDYERYAVELLRHMTVQDAARHLAVSWEDQRQLKFPCGKNS